MSRRLPAAAAGRGLKALVSWSGGKDSALALREARLRGGVEIVGLLTTFSAEFDRVSMHGVRRSLLEAQAAALDLRLEKVFLPTPPPHGPCPSSPARAAQLLSEAGLKGVFPLWKRHTRELMENFIGSGFRAIVVCVDSKKLDSSWAGRPLDEAFLRDLPSGVDPCGENGEFHTFVFDGPGFRNPVPFLVGETVSREPFWFCDLKETFGACSGRPGQVGGEPAQLGGAAQRPV